MEKTSLPAFPVFDCFVQGWRFAFVHRRLLVVLSFFPLAVTLATLAALRFFDNSLGLFLMPVLQLPSNFVMGLQGALILRLIVLGEFPLVPEGPAKLARNRSVSQAALAYTVVTYLITGAYAAVVRARAYLLEQPDAAAPYAPLVVVALVLLMWSTRWFWLHVPMALGWQVRGFYTKVGGWMGSLRIFGLFALCSLVMNFVMAFLRILVSAMAGKDPSGFASAVDDAIVAVATVALSVLFSLSTAAAVRHMAGLKNKNEGRHENSGD